MSLMTIVLVLASRYLGPPMVSEFTTGISKGTYPRTTCWVAVAVAVRYRAAGAMALFKTTPLSFGKPT